MSRTVPEPGRSLSAIAPQELRRVCARFATGVAIATAVTQDGTPTGLTVNSFTSVSAAPPLVLICIDYRASVLSHFRASSWFGINILSSAQEQLSNRFAAYTGDRFEGVPWSPGACTGVPLIDGAIGQMECCVSQVVEAGDHAVFFGEVVAASCNGGDPLLYFGSSYRGLRPVKNPL